MGHDSIILPMRAMDLVQRTPNIHVILFKCTNNYNENSELDDGLDGGLG